MTKLGIDDLEVKGKKIFLRVDFNVPLDAKLNITDTTRIDRTLPTIRSLLDRGAKVALASHLGRPAKADPEFSLAPVAKYLANALDKKVRFSPTVYGDSAKLALSALEEGECLLFENLRFFSEEKKNDPEFSKKIAENFDLYANDAFGSSHRKHSSTYGVAGFFKNAAAGYLMQKELKYLNQALTNVKRPYLVILGGAKIKDKIKVVFNLLSKVDSLLIGGGMAYTFLHVQGKPVGKSILDLDNIAVIEKALNMAQKLGKQILLPTDHKVAHSVSTSEASAVQTVSEIPPDMAGFDIGPVTAETYQKLILPAKLVIWNGPMGVFENPNFSSGTLTIAKALSGCAGTTIVGGGDSVAAVNQAGVAEKLSHVSTGGGASLELLEGTKLPGVEVLADKNG